MAKTSTLSAIAVLLFAASTSMGQTIWNGAKITFSKAASADFTDAANQDRITDNVWITRGNTQSIFNIKTDASYADFQDGPRDTEWAFGTTADISSLTFDTFNNTRNAVGSGGGGSTIVDQDMVVHLITDDVYIDIKFTEWAAGGAGGGAFSYERSSSDPPAGVNQAAAGEGISVFPNPTSESIQLSGLNGQTTYRIYNIKGAEVLNGTALNNQVIDVQALPAGRYFLSLEEGKKLTFTVTK